ncbi:MAG: SIMPL domain-containing protein [Candidatus Bathyarchaeia archaeon]
MKDREFKIAFLSSATLVLLVALAFLTLSPPKNLKTATGVVEENKSTLSVSGISLITVRPDQVSVSLTIETEAETASEALSKNTELMNRVIEAMKQLGLDDRELKTTTLAIYPQYYYPKDEPPVLRGYRAVNTVTVTTKKLEIIGLLIDVAVANGINRIDGIWFSVSDELMNSTKLFLISLAVEDARRKAEAALKPLNMSIIGVKSIEVLDTSRWAIARYETSDMLLQTTPIYPGEVEITVTIYVVFYVS